MALSYDHDRHTNDRGYAGSVQSTHAEGCPVATQAAGVACETIQVEHEHPYQAIIDTADSKGCDLIVMASHGRHGISAIVLGSETVKVLTHCKIPVLVHR
jgi:nucleotide-binding universal stress UspA family protein